MSAERREASRLITELRVALRSAKGEMLDDFATAHDISTKGFKVETQAGLEKDSRIAFAMDLPGGRKIGGTGQVMWVKRETFATWAGLKVVTLSWADARELKAVLSPPTTDWDRVFDVGTKAALVVIVGLALQHLAFHRPSGLGHASRLIPKYGAVLLMGWALLGMLKRR